MSGWVRKKVSDLIDGLTAGVSVRSVDGRSFGPSVLKTSAVDQGRFVPSEAKTILSEDRRRARCNPVAGSLIISRMNTPAMVGDVGYVDRTYPDLYLPDRLWLARPKRSARTDMRWLTYFFASATGSSLLHGLASGTSMSMQSIPKDRVLALEIEVPDVEEQRAIGDVLDAADRLIGAIERLIAKKQAIKHGMMQELLTGKTRLPGFDGDWRRVRLREEGGTYGGLTGKDGSDFGLGSAAYVTFTEVMSGALLQGRQLGRVNVGALERQNQIQRDDVLFNGSSETPEEVALAAVVDYDPTPSTFLNSFCFGYRLRSRKRVDPTYLAYFFRSSDGRKLVSALAQGATRYNIAKTKLMQVAPLMPPLEEQCAIARVLRDVETELDALDIRLMKARAVKQGMMQELLTGRTRLSLAGRAAA